MFYLNSAYVGSYTMQLILFDSWTNLCKLALSHSERWPIYWVCIELAMKSLLSILSQKEDRPGCIMYYNFPKSQSCKTLALPILIFWKKNIQNSLHWKLCHHSALSCDELKKKKMLAFNQRKVKPWTHKISCTLIEL